MLISSVTVVGWSILSVAFLLASVDGWVVPVKPGPSLTAVATSAPTNSRVTSFRQFTGTNLAATTEQEEQQQQKDDEEEKQPQQQQQEPLSSHVLDGVSDFEDWFQSLDNRASCDSSIRHAAFGSLRGLKQQADSLNGRVLDVVATVPKTVVLSSSFADKDWDSQLAILLWKECIKGKESDIHGYCALLARGQTFNINGVPPSTAPNTLRHWTKDQLDGLSLSPKGQKLKTLQTRQEQQWRDKYESAIVKKKDAEHIIDWDGCTMTWEQFEWCMEVVHSRAFRGKYGLSPIRAIGSAAAPLAAAVIGMAYMQGNPDISDDVLSGLAALAALPFLLFNVVVPDEGDVVLLPLIDSANHLEEADSSIQYDPLKGVFSLSVGPKCLVREGDETQLYISYGPRSDCELLLNYGFLPGLSSSDVDTESSRDAYRRRLTEEYVKRGLKPSY